MEIVCDSRFYVGAMQCTLFFELKFKSSVILGAFLGLLFLIEFDACGGVRISSANQ